MCKVKTQVHSAQAYATKALQAGVGLRLPWRSGPAWPSVPAWMHRGPLKLPCIALTNDLTTPNFLAESLLLQRVLFKYTHGSAPQRDSTDVLLDTCSASRLNSPDRPGITPFSLYMWYSHSTCPLSAAHMDVQGKQAGNHSSHCCKITHCNRDMPPQHE